MPGGALRELMCFCVAIWVALEWLSLLDESAGRFELSLCIAGCHQSVMSDFDEPPGENMEEKPPNKLLCCERNEPFPTGV